MSQDKLIFGYVLAGGASSRFGRDKAQVELDGKTMLARTVELLLSVCDKVAAVAATGKSTGGELNRVADRWPGEGPLGGILTALLDSAGEKPATSWNLILGCDMPFLTAEWLVFLAARAAASEAKVVIPQSASGLEPLCGFWRTDAAGPLLASFQAGTRKVTEALANVQTEVLDEREWKRFDSSGRLFWNMNTPADFEAARLTLEAENP